MKFFAPVLVALAFAVSASAPASAGCSLDMGPKAFFTCLDRISD